MNADTYFAHRMYAYNVIFDEAHQLLDMLAGKREIRLWQGSYRFPTGLKTVADLIAWIQGYLRTNEDEKLRRALYQLIRVRHGSVVHYRQMQSKGRSTVVLEVLPSSTRDIPPWLWPTHKVRKIVLLSATIGPSDIDELGLGNRRVAYIQCDSPIPPERRQFIYDRRVNMAHKYVDKALPIFAGIVRDTLTTRPDKGLVHLPYTLAEQLRGLISDPRLLWHTSEDKAAVLEEFKSSPPSQGKVLVASGLYEGVDLPYDAARWQIIGKVPYLSLANPVVAAKVEEDPDWYAWQTWKRLLQASGRIVRAADDFGETLMFDANFERLLRDDDARPTPMVPAYFRKSIVTKRK
jgi:hypothetical protein